MIAAAGEFDARPTPIGNAAVDQHGAALIAMGIAAAYAKKLTTGKGTRIDANLLNAGIDLQTEPLTAFMCRSDLTREVFRRDKHLASWYHPAPYGVYQLKDCFLAIAMNGTERALSELLKSETLIALCEKDLLDERDAFAQELASELAGRKFDEIRADLESGGIWYQIVQDYEDLKSDPQLEANQIFHKVPVGDETATLVNHPLRYDGEIPSVRHIAVNCGEDGRDILAELDFDQTQIDEMYNNGALYETKSRENGKN